MSFPVARTFKYQMLAIPTPVGQTTQKSEERKRMNVLGKNERSWRKARKRGVSPIIATILLVAITVVLAAVLYVLISGLTHGPGNTPIGTAFQAGNPTPGQQTAATGAGTCAAGTTTLLGALTASEWTYTLTIESSSVTFGSIGLEVKASSGSVLPWAAGGFYIVNTGGAVVACALGTGANGFAAISGLTYTTGGGVSSSNSLSTIYTIVIDTGSHAATNPWTGVGNNFVAIGIGSYSGTSAAVNLP
jgi:archaeal type IV pilus assembly protein PilA